MKTTVYKTETIYARKKDNHWRYTKSNDGVIDGYERKYKLKVKPYYKMIPVNGGEPKYKGQTIMMGKREYMIYRIINEPYIPYEVHLENMKEIIKNYPPSNRNITNV